MASCVGANRNSCKVLVRKPDGERPSGRPKHIRKDYRVHKNQTLGLQRNPSLCNSWRLKLPELISKNNVSWEAMLCSPVVWQLFEAAFHLRVHSTYLLPARFSQTSLNLHHTSRNYTRYGNILQFNPIQIPSDYFCRTHLHVVSPSRSYFLLWDIPVKRFIFLSHLSQTAASRKPDT